MFVVWRTPTENGGGEILSYVIQLFQGENKIAQNETMDTSFRYSNLEMRTRYRVEVAAKNIVNTSQPVHWVRTTRIEGNNEKQKN